MSLIDYKKPFAIPVGLKQKFDHEFNYKLVNQSVLIKMKDNGSITDRDVEIAKFLFKVRFATVHQIFRVLNASNKANLKNRLEKLVKYKILNKFVLTNDEESNTEQLQIYCLDIGGRYLLSSYSTLDTTSWNTSVNMKAPELVGENLLATEFYVKLEESCPDKLLRFELYPEFSCGNRIVVPTFRFSLLVKDEAAHFICDVVRDYHFPDEFIKKAQKLDSIISTNAWKKYYKDDKQPILFVFADEDSTALEAAQAIDDFTQIKKYRISTDERIKEDLNEAGVFLKYEESKEDPSVKVFKTQKMPYFK